ncbi:MAG: M23 family metallopeptidase [Gammaproteobacteria bacterium]|nr:M23 family metallopeptidase [Gammaproteobacteria bacterium]
MAIVIVSASTLASSRMRTLTMRALAVAAGALALVGLLGGFVLGFQLGGASHVDDGWARVIANLDPAQPGSQTLIHEIGSLSGRLIRLEAAADRLAARIGTTPPATADAADSPATVAGQPAGGPLLEPQFGAGSGTGASLPGLDRSLDHAEATLDKVASMVARRDLDQMAFPSRAPIPGVMISSGFGRRIDPFTRHLARHAGIDYVAPFGTPILASAGGRVRRAGPYGAFGRTVEIDHGDGLVTRYGHTSRILVRVGDIVLPGQPIAMVGSTGRSTGAHLHFEILRDGTPVQPRLYIGSDEF